MTRSFSVTPKTTEQHLIARNDKFLAYVTNNKKNSARRFVLLKLSTDKHEVSRGLFAIAELLVKTLVELMLSFNWYVTLRLTVFKIFAVKRPKSVSERQKWSTRSPFLTPHLETLKISPPKGRSIVWVIALASCTLSSRSVSPSPRWIIPQLSVVFGVL